MNNLQLFKNEDFGQVRVIEVNNKPWFVGIDIAYNLGYQNGSRDIERHTDEEDRLLITVDDGVQGRRVIAINESGLYSLILGSKLKTAKKFKRWVTDEILPTINKHGAYMTPETIEKTLTDPDFIIKLATNLKNERQARMDAENKVKELTPAAEFGMTVGSSQGGILIRDYVKLLANDGIIIGQAQFFSWLHAHGYIYRTKEYKPQWKPYMKYVHEQGLFKLREIPISTNENGDQIKFTIRITGKGQKYFYEKLKKEKKGA